MKKKFKKILAVLIASALTLSMVACGNSDVTRKSLENGEEIVEEDTEATTERVIEYDTKESFDDSDEAVQAAFEEFLDDYFAEYATQDTVTYNYTVKDGSTYGLEEPELTLGECDMSDDAIAAEKEEFEEWFARLEAIDRTCLTADQQLTYDVIYEYCELETVAYDNVYLYEPFSPMRGLQANVSTSFTEYRFDDASDVENYIALLYLLPDYFDGYLDFEVTKSEQGYFMSDAVCEEVIEQCEDFLTYDDVHFMVTVFNEKVDDLDFLTEAEKADYKEQNAAAVEDGLLPAFENTIEVLTSLKGTGTNDQGICYYEGGSEYYEYLLQYYSGTSKTADEVYEILEEKMNDLMTEIYEVYFACPSAYEYFATYYDELFDDVDGMTATEIIDYLMENVSENYPDCGTITYEAKGLEEDLQNIMDSTLAYYLSPAIDDPEGNIIRVNGLYTSGLFTTLAHEGFPGHMLQNAYFMSTDPEPVRTTFTFLGYAEGWAMYVAYAAIEEYDFGGNEYAQYLGKLYRINEEMSYLAMGMLDLGINAQGWSIEECEEFLDAYGFSGAAAEDMYTTFIGDPGVYQSYSTAYYELLEIKEYAEETLGDTFDLLEFNTAVLETGPCQYDILKVQVMNKLAANNAI